MKNTGWVRIYRKINENWLWENETFTKGQAWIDLILQVNHTERKILFGNKICTVGIGETITSLLKLSEKWGWSIHKVSNFLNLLATEGMITQKRDTKKTIINVLNYKTYQEKEQDEGNQKETKRKPKEKQKETNKNVKNEKNDKKTTVFDFIYLTEFEHNKLLKDYGLEVTDTYLHKLDDYIGVIGEDVAKKKYKSHYHVIKSWHRKDK